MSTTVSPEGHATHAQQRFTDHGGLPPHPAYHRRTIEGTLGQDSSYYATDSSISLQSPSSANYQQNVSGKLPFLQTRGLCIFVLLLSPRLYLPSCYLKVPAMTFIPLMIQRALSLPRLRSGKVYTLNNFRALSNIRTPTCHRCQKTSITWPLMIVLHLVLQIDGIRIPYIILMMAAPHGLMK